VLQRIAVVHRCRQPVLARRNQPELGDPGRICLDGIDRLVLCPNSSDNLHSALRVEWSDSLRDGRLRAVCEVERDDVRAGEWTWAPRDRGRVLVMSAAGEEAMRDHDDLAGPFQQTGEWDTDLITNVPHRYCRISRIRVWHAGSDADPPTELATFAYCAGEGAAGTRPSDIALPAPCPRHERSLNVRTDEWVVTLPREAEAVLRRSLALDTDTSNTPASVPATGRQDEAMPTFPDRRPPRAYRFPSTEVY
jgi:hypothetical protein